MGIMLEPVLPLALPWISVIVFMGDKSKININQVRLRNEEKYLHKVYSPLQKMYF